MTYFARASKSVVIRANRETIGLVAAACAVAFALADAVHSRPAPTASGQQHQQDWTGDLAELEAPETKSQEPLRSADLVVPQADLALPTMPAKPVARKGCDEPCVKAPLPPRRAAATATRVAAKKDAGFLDNLNPLNHVPDMVSRPFNYAGNVVSGWIKQF
jgi:hypothetical protein